MYKSLSHNTLNYLKIKIIYLSEMIKGGSIMTERRASWRSWGDLADYY